MKNILVLFLCINLCPIRLPANEFKLMPESVFIQPKVGLRSAPVYLESELWDVQKNQRNEEIDFEILQAIQKYRNNSTILNADEFVGRKKKFVIEGGIELNPAESENLFIHLISEIKAPTFIFVSDKLLSKVKNLIRKSSGSNIIVLLPYKNDGNRVNINLLTAPSDVVPKITQFFEHYLYSNNRQLIHNLISCENLNSSRIIQSQIPGETILADITPMLAALPDLTEKIKLQLLTLNNIEVLEVLSQRADLTIDDLAALISSGHIQVLKTIIYKHSALLIENYHLVKQLVKRLFENEDEGVSVFIEYLSKLNNNDNIGWLLKPVVNHFYENINQEDEIFYAGDEKELFKRRIIDNPLIPNWVKGLILERMYLYKNNSMFNGASYVQNILDLSEDNTFWEWFEDSGSGPSDTFGLWLRVILSAPEVSMLRDEALLKKLEIHYRMDALEKYDAFLKTHYSNKWKSIPLIQSLTDLEALIGIFNQVVTSKIPNRERIFKLAEEAVPLLHKKAGSEVTFSEAVNMLGADFSVKEGSFENKIDLISLIPALVLSKGDEQLYQNIVQYYSYKFVQHSNDLKNLFTNELLKIDHGAKIEVLKLIMGLAVKNGVKNRKKRQKEVTKSIQLLNVLSEMIDSMNQDDSNEYFIGLNSYTKRKILSKNYKNISEFYQYLLSLVARFIEELLDEEQKKLLEAREAVNRFKVILDFVKYRQKWNDVYSEGIQDLEEIFLSYLLHGEDVKALKYGDPVKNPEAFIQMQAYRAILKRELIERFDSLPMESEEKQVWIEKLLNSYLKAWKKDQKERITPFEVNGEAKEPLTVWSSDSPSDWLRLGQDGAESCLVSNGDPLMNRALLGRVMSGLSKMKYIGDKLGDRSTRATESLAFIEEEGSYVLVLSQEQIFSNVNDPEKIKNIAEVGMISLIRNAAAFGVNKIFIPRAWDGGDAIDDFVHYEAVLKDFSVVIEHKDSSGQLIAREEVKIDGMHRKKVKLVGLKEKHRWRNWVGRISVNDNNFQRDALHIVDQNLAVTMEIEGIKVRGLEIGFDGLLIELNKKLTVWSEADPSGEKQRLPEKVKELYSRDKSISEPLLKLKRNGLTAAEYLNLMYLASERVIQFMDEDIFGDQTKRKEVRLIVAIPRGGLPVARTLKQKWPKSRRKTGYLRAKNGKILSKYLPYLQRTQKKTVYLVDEVIVSGRSIVNSVHELLNHGFKQEEIVVLVLGAKLEGIQEILKRYPNLKAIYTGMIEDEKKFETVGSLSGLITGGERSHPLIWDEGEDVNIKGKTYKLLYRIESKRSFNLFLAEDKDKKKVVIKTTVAGNERRNIYKLASALWQEKDNYGFVKIIDYDPNLGAIVMELVEGEVAGKFFSDETGLNRVAYIAAYAKFIIQYTELLGFLKRKKLFYLRFDTEHLKWDHASKKWVFTNYTEIPGSRNDSNSEKEFMADSNRFVRKMTYLFFQSMSFSSKTDHKEMFRQLNALLQSDQLQNVNSLVGTLNQIYLELHSAFPNLIPESTFPTSIPCEIAA